MGYHPRIETKEHGTFITTRTRRSEMWFVNNPKVEYFALSQLAKLRERYKPKLYAFALPASHYHAAMDFPLLNRSHFTRDFNSSLAKGVAKLTSNYPGGRLWARRYSGEVIAGKEDIERQFFYTVLQPVQDGLVDKISKYKGYKCFHDAIHGIERQFKIVNWTKYNAAKRYKTNIAIKDYTEIVTLKYDRLPGYEELTQKEYAKLMKIKLEEYRQEVIKKRIAEGKRAFVGEETLSKILPGTPAKNPKVSNINSHRPRVLSSCNRRRAKVKDWYFKIYFAYKEASRRYRAGELSVDFPHGTYRPPMWTVVVSPTGPYSVL